MPKSKPQQVPRKPRKTTKPAGKSPRSTVQKKRDKTVSAAKTPTKSRKDRQPVADSVELPGQPVTLAEVRSMVQTRPKSKVAAVASRRALGGKPLATAATVGALGAERKKLRLQRLRENQRRIAEYKAMMDIMKKRGVKGLTAQASATSSRRGTPGPTLAAPSRAPLQIFAEGDSWFDYPPFIFKGGVIPRLEDRLGVPILNLAKAGDEVRFMLGVDERKILEQQLRKGSPAGGSWDVLLFSGGGNDIVDNPMALWVRDFRPGANPSELIHQPRYDTALALVRAGYEDLIALRDSLSPSTHLVFHAYDFAIPDGRGICHLGPWLKPTFDLRKFPANTNTSFEVVKEMLRQFAAMLDALAQGRNDITFINGQGTLAPKRDSWHNELHPNQDGFEKFAGLFQQKLKALFPARVL